MITAPRIHAALDGHGFPTDWHSAMPIRFSHDWQGRNSDAQRETEVRILWSDDHLFLRFRARYRALYTYDAREVRQDALWDRDVAEAFLQPPGQTGRNYAEFEVSPNGSWLDLAIEDGKLRHLHCEMRSRVEVDATGGIWNAEMAIPMTAITANFDPHLPWRVNFFRIEGSEPDRFYSSWKPTNTERPNFHVPEAFATLRFETANSSRRAGDYRT